jgi:hypothetical protein
MAETSVPASMSHLCLYTDAPHTTCPQEFSADMNSRPLQRINDVVTLRSSQFTEDAGPMAHPIRPDAYIKVGDAYTHRRYSSQSATELMRTSANALTEMLP